VLLAIDLHEDFIDVERIAITTVSPFMSASESGTKLNTPASSGFVADSDTSFWERVFDITIAWVESMLKPNRITDDIGWESVTLVCVHH
jgi:hypothetical protein